MKTTRKTLSKSSMKSITGATPRPMKVKSALRVGKVSKLDALDVRPSAP